MSKTCENRDEVTDITRHEDVEECDFFYVRKEYYDAGMQLDGSLLLVKVSLQKQLCQTQTQKSCFVKAKCPESHKYDRNKQRKKLLF